jgi:hypothetical protein
MSGRRTYLFAAIAAACVLCLAACGGGGSNGGSTSSTTATGGTTTNDTAGNPAVAKSFETYSGEKNVNCVPSGVTNLSNNEPVFLCTGVEPGGTPVPCAPMVWDGKTVSKPDVNGAFDTGSGTFSC